MRIFFLGVQVPRHLFCRESDWIFICVNGYYSEYLYLAILWIEASGSYFTRKINLGCLFPVCSLGAVIEQHGARDDD